MNERVEGYLHHPILVNANSQQSSIPQISSDESDSENEENRIGNTDWCQCDNCSISFQTAKECTCCQEWPGQKSHDPDVILDLIHECPSDCILSHKDFNDIILKRSVLRVAFAAIHVQKYGSGKIPKQLTNR